MTRFWRFSAIGSVGCCRSDLATERRLPGVPVTDIHDACHSPAHRLWPLASWWCAQCRRSARPGGRSVWPRGPRWTGVLFACRCM